MPVYSMKTLEGIDPGGSGTPPPPTAQPPTQPPTQPASTRPATRPATCPPTQPPAVHFVRSERLFLYHHSCTLLRFGARGSGTCYECFGDPPGLTWGKQPLGCSCFSFVCFFLWFLDREAVAHMAATLVIGGEGIGAVWRGPH